MRRSRRVALLATALLVVLATSVRAGTAAVSLTPKRLPVGEVAHLTLEISRGDLGSLHLEPQFRLDNFEVVSGPAKRESFSWMNGQLTRSLALTWYLAPQRAGRARVYDVKLLLDGKAVALPSQEAVVDEGGAPRRGSPTATAPGDDDVQGGVGADAASGRDPLSLLLPELFRRRHPLARPQGEPEVLLRAELTPANPWAGQQLVYTLYLLAERRTVGGGRLHVETIFPRRVPAFQGFWSQEIQLPERAHAELVELGDRLWWRQAILQRALFPYEPGAHVIESAEADLRIVYYSPLAFGLAEEPRRPGTLRRRSNDVRVQVRALPAAPPGFGGAVGRLTAHSTLGPGRVEAGEGVALTAELSGGGNLGGLPDPRLPPLPGVTVGPPQEATQQKVVGTRVESTRTWVWTLVPERAGKWRIPAQEWVTFDPEAGKYVTLRTSPQTLEALPATPQPAATQPAARREAVAGWRRPALWATAGAGAVMLVAGLVALLARLRRRDPAARRRLLADVHSALAEAHPPRQAAGAAEQAWRRFLGERFELPPESPPAQWPGHLAARGLEQRVAGELVRLVDDLHYLRYAPQLASTDALQRELLERSRRLARHLA